MAQPEFPIRPTSVRFIKLGRKGEWEAECVDVKQILRFGFMSGRADQLEDMRNHRWDKIRADWLKGGKRSADGEWKPNSKTKATTAANALRAYFEDDGTTLWVTFHRSNLYWCFLEPGEPVPVGDERHSSYRTVRGKWSCKDANGITLSRTTLPGTVNVVSMYQGTTCLVGAAEQLLRRINGERSRQGAKVESARDQLIVEVQSLIRELQWQDFEILADLLLSAGGWRRTDRLGGNEKTVDLTLELPLTGEEAFAQVKADSNQATLENYVQAANDRKKLMFFVHNSDQELASPDPLVRVLGRAEVSRLIVKFGLVDWLIEKTR